MTVPTTTGQTNPDGRRNLARPLIILDERFSVTNDRDEIEIGSTAELVSPDRGLLLVARALKPCRRGDRGRWETRRQYGV